jgi:dihydrofolate reductase
MYETMLYWETANLDENQPALVRDFTEIWQAAEKIVYSRTLESVSSARTRIERHFDANAVRHLKATSERDVTIGGASLAAQAMKAGLVDELHLFVVPVVVGGGKPWLPEDVRLDLQLLDTRRFAEGTVYLRYCPEPMIAI